MIQQSFGGYLRQLRRQQGFTQSELGSDQFSKSYISAVERTTVIPSQAALVHFAAKLQQPIEDFERLLQQTGSLEQELQQPLAPPLLEEHEQDILSLLDVILKGNQKIPHSLPEQLENYAHFTSAIGSWQERQAKFLFLNGLMQQENGDLLTARSSFEQALALAAADYHLFICNALGTNYMLTQDYVSALRYHQRALALLKKEDYLDEDLLQQLEYRCGDDYRALSFHEQACQHFEEASRRVNANSNIVSAGKLYLGWGYCTYASLFQRSHLASIRKTLSPEEVERSFQLAASYLLQSRILYQVSSDTSGEMHARLTQTKILLDWSFWKYHLLLEDMSHDKQKARLLGGGNLLDDAYEQSQQVLLALLEPLEPSEERRSFAIMAITYLIRVALRRAMQARVNNYTDTSTRERLLAIHLGEWLLRFLESASFSRESIQHCINISDNDINYRMSSIASFEVLEKAKIALPNDTQTLAEVCLTFGELAEEIALVDRISGGALTGFQLADECFQQALASAGYVVPGKDHDMSYALRLYQHYVTIIEHRTQLISASEEYFSQMLTIVKEAFLHLPVSIILPHVEPISV